ncbi:restriction endonuclease subunit S [Raoultella planticola]
MIVPKLRFTGFNEPWSETSLGKISSFITSGSRDWAQYYSDCGDKFIRMTNLVRDGITLNLSDLKFVRLPENSNEGKRTALQHHDILISITAELGKLGWVPDDLGTAYINQHTALVRPNLSIASSKFVANLLSTKKYNNILNQHNDSGAKSGLNLSTIKNFGFYAPNKIEQTKIADFLSSVDEKITLLNKQHDLLCQYKKGWMQKIFSQEVRFKDESGEKFSDWNEILLGKVGEIITGKTPSTSVDEFWNGDILFTTPTDMNDSIKYLVATERKVTSKGIKRVLPKGTIMFTCIASIGKMALSTLPCITNQQINSIIVNEKYNNEFIYYCLQFIKPKIISNQANTTVPIVNKSDFSAISLRIPNLAEQTKIANFLSALDDKIAVKKAELDKLKTWKQGLLQQMFV